MDMDEARILEGQTHRHTSGHNSMTRKIMKKKNIYDNTLLNQKFLDARSKIKARVSR